MDFLGTNGAGKTTTIRMILGILKKDSGEITWNGKKYKGSTCNFGYLPEERGVYPKTKVHDQLMYFAKLKRNEKRNSRRAYAILGKRLEVEQYLQMTPEKVIKREINKKFNLSQQFYMIQNC